MDHPAISLQSPHAFFIDGTWAKPRTERKLSVISPVTEQVFMTVAEGTERDMDDAVGAARKTFDSGEWPRLSGADRGRMLLRVAAELEKRLPELTNLDKLSIEMIPRDVGW